MMSGNSRRKNSWAGIHENQERQPYKTDLTDSGYSPLKSYRVDQHHTYT